VYDRQSPGSHGVKSVFFLKGAEQSSLIQEHFGRLQAQHFKEGRSVAMRDDAPPGGTLGFYVFRPLRMPFKYRDASCA
jgi:hypothetical protein